MTTTTTTLVESEEIRAKTRALCQAIVEAPAYIELRRQVDVFLADESAKEKFQTVVEKSEALHQKQHMGVPPSSEEVEDYERHRQELLENPIAKAFLDAREELGRVQEQVSRHLNKTLELGRVAEASDFEGGSCGSGCGCHH